MSKNDDPAFHSRFGGLWVDRDDWRQQITARHLTSEQINQIEFFVRNGFIILRAAATLEKVDAFRREIETFFREENRDVLYQRHNGHDTLPSLISFLQLIFDTDPLLFQSLSFDQGSQQGLYQDTAYVVVDQPLELAACWIALEDMQPGLGELMYVPGSHRLPDWNFGGDRKHWVATEDGKEPHDDWARHLTQHAKDSQYGIQHFLPKKGDILVWYADLPHGGAPVKNPDLTRQSLVGHFCPQGRSPHFFCDIPSFGHHSSSRSACLLQPAL